MTLDDLRKIAEAATSGPWTVEREVEETDFGKFEIFSVDPVTAFSWNADDTPAHTALDTLEEADAEFIATFNPQRVLELIDNLNVMEERHSLERLNIARLEAENKRLREQRDSSHAALQLNKPAHELRARLAAVEKLHPLVKVYDECDHENCTAEPVEVYDYTACTDSLIGYACRNCCFQNSDYMAESCSHGLDHDDTTETTYCPTIKAVRGE